MDDPNQNLFPCGTQIDDLPSCLIVDILSRLPTTSLLRCRVVCRNWNLDFSDPLFVKLHLARSPPYQIRVNEGKPMKFYSSYCRSLVPGMSSEASESQANDKLWESTYTCINSSNGLLCLQNSKSPDEVYMCNPILGQYITIKTGNTEIVGFFKFCLGFSSRSNQFKVLEINSAENTVPYLARIYTIGDGTREWKSIGIAPSCPFGSNFMWGGFLNGSIHWADEETHEIFYFNFDSEQFGSLPSPPVPVPRDGRRRSPIIGVLDGCLFFFPGSLAQEEGFWMMKEYGDEKSWTNMFSIYSSEPFLYENCRVQSGVFGAIYNPSFISLQDVAKCPCTQNDPLFLYFVGRRYSYTQMFVSWLIVQMFVSGILMNDGTFPCQSKSFPA